MATCSCTYEFVADHSNALSTGGVFVRNWQATSPPRPPHKPTPEHCLRKRSMVQLPVISWFPCTRLNCTQFDAGISITLQNRLITTNALLADTDPEIRPTQHKNTSIFEIPSRKSSLSSVFWHEHTLLPLHIGAGKPESVEPCMATKSDCEDQLLR